MTKKKQKTLVSLPHGMRDRFAIMAANQGFNSTSDAYTALVQHIVDTREGRALLKKLAKGPG